MDLQKLLRHTDPNPPHVSAVRAQWSGAAVSFDRAHDGVRVLLAEPRARVGRVLGVAAVPLQTAVLVVVDDAHLACKMKFVAARSNAIRVIWPTTLLHRSQQVPHRHPHESASSPDALAYLMAIEVRSPPESSCASVWPGPIVRARRAPGENPLQSVGIAICRLRFTKETFLETFFSNNGIPEMLFYCSNKAGWLMRRAISYAKQFLVVSGCLMIAGWASCPKQSQCSFSDTTFTTISFAITTDGDDLRGKGNLLNPPPSVAQAEIWPKDGTSALQTIPLNNGNEWDSSEQTVTATIANAINISSQSMCVFPGLYIIKIRMLQPAQANENGWSWDTWTVQRMKVTATGPGGASASLVEVGCTGLGSGVDLAFTLGGGQDTIVSLPIPTLSGLNNLCTSGTPPFPGPQSSGTGSGGNIWLCNWSCQGHSGQVTSSTNNCSTVLSSQCGTSTGTCNCVQN